MKSIAIVLAAGSGKRMNMDIPKQFALIDGLEMVCYSLKNFEKSNADRIILVTGDKEINLCRELVIREGYKKVTDIIAGGKERYDSVYEGLKCAAGDPEDIVLIHDCARPMITWEKINFSIEECKKYGAVALGVPVKDTIRNIVSGKVVPRKDLSAMQTPQTFIYRIVADAYTKLQQVEDKSGITDDVQVVRDMLGVESRIIEGDYRNIKVTTSEDLLIAQMYLSEKRGNI